MKNSRVQILPTNVVIQTKNQTHSHYKIAPIDWTCLAFTACCWFLPLGLVALIFAYDANSAAERGSLERAHRSACIAGTLTMITLFGGLSALVTYIALVRFEFHRVKFLG